MQFKERLKELRLSCGISQVDLGKKLGISHSSLAMYETGKRTPSYELLEAIADFFNVDMNYLLGYEDRSTYLLEPSDAYLIKQINERECVKRLIEVALAGTDTDVEVVTKLMSLYNESNSQKDKGNSPK